MTGALHVEYCGDWTEVEPGRVFRIGRSGDLVVDDNPYLHRNFLECSATSGMWVVANVGTQLSASVGDPDGHFMAHLAPGGLLPLVFDRTCVRFGAGSTTYEIGLVLSRPPFETCVPNELATSGATTRGRMQLTPDHLLLVLALAEPALRNVGTGPAALPSTGDAARRLGWTERKFHKKLDQLCQKLDGAGVRGLHGSPGNLASNRRARLVEFCLSSRIVTPADLVRLDAPVG